MTYPDGPDRRLHPRWRARRGVEGRLQTRTRVRLIDISASGALLGSEMPLPVGTPAQLRATVGAAPFCPDLEIRRVADGTHSSAIGLGAMFISMDDESRRSLQTFLKLASS